jgi:hypothetical protein
MLSNIQQLSGDQGPARVDEFHSSPNAIDERLSSQRSARIIQVTIGFLTSNPET